MSHGAAPGQLIAGRSGGLALVFAARLHVRIALALILVLALLLRIIPLTYSHFWDETVYLQHAKVFLGMRSNYDEFFLRPPLLPTFYAIGFALWNNIFVANIVQGVLTALAVLLAYLYARLTFGTTAAILAAFLLAFAPYMVETSHELLTDMPAVALMLAAMWLFDKPGARFALLAGVAGALAVQMRFTSLYLAVYFALDVATSPYKLRRAVVAMLAAAATLLPYLIWIRWNFDSFFYPFELARRIVTEWTAPVPSRFYIDALPGIFPPSTWIAFALGVLAPFARLVRPGKEAASREPTRPGPSQAGKRTLVLLLWAMSFLAYMLTIPHKEMRYLLPLAIPVTVIGGAGAATLVRWVGRRAAPVRIAALLLVGAIVTADDATSLGSLRGPWVDRSESEEVQIAHYLRDVSSDLDAVYAAHNFPVFAFYTSRNTVSLLPIQDTFEQDWRELMRQPGFLVYYAPAAIQESHALHPLKPDAAFLAAHAEFTAVRTFPSATVYRYEPAR